MRKNKNSNIDILFQILIILTLFNFAFGPVVAGKIKQGNKLFNEGKYEEALTKYTNAQLEEPESPEIYFNIADTLYRQNKYNEAEQLLSKAIPNAAGDLEAKVYYNIGNCKYRQGQLRESIDYYKKTLELNPDDEDAKYNIEFVERKIKEMLSKQNERKEQQEQQEREQQQQQKGEQQQEQEQEQQKEEQSAEESEQKKEAEREGAKEQQAPEPMELNEEETEALLRMTAEEERSAGKPEDKAERRPGSYQKVDKPW